MRGIIIVILFVFCFQNFGISQTEFKKDKIYKIWIYTTNNPFKEKGYLYAIKDSTVILANNLTTKNKSSENPILVEINIQDIQKIKIRRRGNIWRGATIGAVTGLLFGSMIATTHKGEGGAGSDQVQKYVYYGGSMAILGIGLGALFGSIKVKIPINENIDSFNLVREKLQIITIN